MGLRIILKVMRSLPCVYLNFNVGMRRVIICCLLMVIAPSLYSQDVSKFVRNYRIAYRRISKNDFLDTSLVYIPSVLNLYENSKGFYKQTKAQRRLFLFDFLSNPNVVRDLAVNPESGELFEFYLADLIETSKHKDRRWSSFSHILRPKKTNHNDEYLPIINYIRTNEFDYIFTIANIYSQLRICSKYWVIKEGGVFLLEYDKTSESLKEIDLQSFTSNPCYDDMVWDINDFFEWFATHDDH